MFPCDNLSSNWQILLNFEHSDPLHWIKVGIDFVYYCPTCFQRRDPKVKKLKFWRVFVMNSSGKSFSEKCIGLLCNYYHFWHKRAPKGEFHIFYFFIFHPILMQYTLVQLSLVDMLRSYHASLCESMHLYFLPFCSCWEFSHINNLLFILIKNHMRKLQAMFMNRFYCVSLGLLFIYPFKIVF